MNQSSITIRGKIGIGSLIIRKKNLTNNQIASSFTLLVCIAFVLTVINIVLAPIYINIYSHSVFDRILLLKIIRVYSISIFLSGIFIIPQSILQRELNFQRLSLNFII